MPGTPRRKCPPHPTDQRGWINLDHIIVGSTNHVSSQPCAPVSDPIGVVLGIAFHIQNQSFDNQFATSPVRFVQYKSKFSFTSDSLTNPVDTSDSVHLRVRP